MKIEMELERVKQFFSVAITVSFVDVKIQVLLYTSRFLDKISKNQIFQIKKNKINIKFISFFLNVLLFLYSINFNYTNLSNIFPHLIIFNNAKLLLTDKFTENYFTLIHFTITS